MVTAKDMNIIAEAVARLPHSFDDGFWNMANTSYREELAFSLAEALECLNPRFDWKRFMTVCEIDDDSPVMDRKSEIVMGVRVQGDGEVVRREVMV